MAATMVGASSVVAHHGARRFGSPGEGSGAIRAAVSMLVGRGR